MGCTIHESQYRQHNSSRLSSEVGQSRQDKYKYKSYLNWKCECINKLDLKKEDLDFQSLHYPQYVCTFMLHGQFHNVHGT